MLSKTLNVFPVVCTVGLEGGILTIAKGEKRNTILPFSCYICLQSQNTCTLNVSIKYVRCMYKHGMG